MEVIFNMGEGIWKVKIDDTFYTTPAIELWGQITKPLLIKSVGKNTMLGIRFYPHSADGNWKIIVDHAFGAEPV